MSSKPPPIDASEQRIALFTLRALFFASAMGLGLYVAQSVEATGLQFVAMIVSGTIALAVIMVDTLAVARSSIGTVSAIVFGLLIGLLVAQIFVGIVSLVVEFESEGGKETLGAIRLALVLIFCYLGPAYILRTQDDLRFIVPYVEFRRQAQGPKPLVLDTSAIIDGRIVDVARCNLFDAPLIVPRFVIEELQKIADSGDRGRRERGRLGLERLKRLREDRGLEVEVIPATYAQQDEVDRRLIEVTRFRDGKLVTCDYNLQQVCEVEGVATINLNQLAEAVKLSFVAGETLRVRITRKGEGPEQGVGYLEDGTMVVVEGARDQKGKTITCEVTSTIQSSQGRMVFARTRGEGSQPAETEATS
ncbi:MAG: TRAM domain-containing protein [Planctomycetota bacterium]